MAVLAHKRPEAPAVLRLLSDRNDELIYAKDYGCTGLYSQDATQNLRDACAYAPDGAIIDFSHGVDTGGDFKVTDTITITKHLSLRGRNSRIVGVMANTSTDLIHYRPTAELRNAFVEGMRLALNSNGRHALFWDGELAGILNCATRNCNILGGLGGYAIKINAGATFNYIEKCALSGLHASYGCIYLSCADGTHIQDCNLGHIGHGIRIVLLNGAYKTRITGGTIVTRDSGVIIEAGQQIDFTEVQFEQIGTNTATYKAHLVIDGTPFSGSGGAGAEEVRDIVIRQCNFGGGPNLDTSIILVDNAIDVTIEDNVFNGVGNSGYDIQILASTCTGTVIGRPRLGGNRGIGARGTANSTDPKELLYVSDAGTGTYGMMKGQANFTEGALQNSWSDQTGSITASISTNVMTVTAVGSGAVGIGDFITGTGVTAGTKVVHQLSGSAGSTGTYSVSIAQTVSSTTIIARGMAFWKDIGDILRFRGSITAGTVTAGTTVGTLPAGFRPRRATRFSVPTNTDDDYAMFAISTAGVISVRSAPASSICYLDQVSIPIQGRPSYLSPPI